MARPIDTLKEALSEAINELMNRMLELDELYTKLHIVTGFTAEQLLEMFCAGYTLEKPDYSNVFEKMASLAEDTPPNEWVRVEERLPEEKEMCLLYTPRDGIMCVGFYAGNDNWEHKHKWKLVTAMRSSQTLTKKVTHWMPLPEPPDRRPPEGEEANNE